MRYENSPPPELTESEKVSPTGLEERQIRRIHEQFQKNVNSPEFTLNESDARAARIVGQLEKLSGIKMLHRFNEVDYLRKHRAFVESCQDLLPEPEIEDQTDLNQMVLSSELLALHFMLVNDGIDLLYNNYLREHPEFEEAEESTVQDIQTVLLARYLASMGEKNKTLALAHQEVVPIGMEYEYSDRVMRFLQNDKRAAAHPNTKKIQAKLVQHYEYVKPQHKFINEGFRFVSKSLAELGRYADLPEDQQSFVEEIVTSPTYSPREELRKLLHLKKAGALEKKINVHMTFAGVELSPEHTEIMDARAILTATGLLRKPETVPAPKIKAFKTSRQRPLYKEKYAKTSPVTDAGEIPYFPYFRARSSATLSAIDNRDFASGVEVRSLPAFEDQDFARLVRITTYFWLSANAIKAIQKPLPARTEHENALASIWEIHISEWKALLQQHGITPLVNSDYFVMTNDVDVNYQDPIPYEYFLSDILVQMVENEEFRQTSFRMVTDFNRQVKEILNY